MRNLVLILIAFIAMATLITAFDKPVAGNLNEATQKEAGLDFGD